MSQKLILTPTPRLARALTRQLANDRVARGETAWRQPEILPWSAWMSRLLDDWLLTSGETRVPLIGAQATAIWSELIDRDVFLATGRVARLVERSWRELHEWGLPDPENWPGVMLNDDTRQFRRWVATWRARLDEGDWLDPVAWQAALPERIAAGEIALPESITLHGFELPPTPLMTRIVEAIKTAGVRVYRELPPSHAKGGTLQPTADSEDELRQAAAWAREHAEQHRRVAIVVPDLNGRLSDVDRILRDTLRPDSFRLAQESHPPWHISLGLPLMQWPLAADTLRALHADPAGLDILEFGTLLRSPFLFGWNAERDVRAMLDAKLRALPGDRVTLFRVQRAIGDDLPQLSARLQAWRDCRRQAESTAPPSAWAQQFSSELEAIGLGAGRPLNSVEFQVLDAWQGVLEQFATLDAVARTLDRQAALARLGELAQARVFREQNPGVPIEVLGLLEALGGDFDDIWVTGMDEASWPPPARPDPLLPRELQKARPEATPDGMLEQSRRILAGLVRVAPEVIFSWQRTRDDELLAPSRLLTNAARPGIAGTGRGMPAGHDRPPVMDQPWEDIQAPAHPGGKVRGGAGLLANQSACPFKSFAAHRLDAEELEHPSVGLDARARGTLMHEALEHLWKQVRSSEELERLLSGLETRDSRLAVSDPVAENHHVDFAKPEETQVPNIRASAEHAVSKVLDDNRLALSPVLRTLETERLASRLRDWLDIERTRPPFRMAQAEQWLKLEAGGLTLTGKLDRIDELEDGGTLLIDYKTGAVTTRNWSPEERLRDPQLPLYCLNADPPPTGIAFACLRPDRIGWQGLAETDLEIDGIKPLGKAGRTFAEIEDWRALINAWRERITALAAEFCAGHAAVDPRDSSVCNYCHLGALCRIRERS